MVIPGWASAPGCQSGDDILSHQIRECSQTQSPQLASRRVLTLSSPLFWIHFMGHKPARMPVTRSQSTGLLDRSPGWPENTSPARRNARRTKAARAARNQNWNRNRPADDQSLAAPPQGGGTPEDQRGAPVPQGTFPTAAADKEALVATDEEALDTSFPDPCD